MAKRASRRIRGPSGAAARPQFVEGAELRDRNGDCYREAILDGRVPRVALAACDVSPWTFGRCSAAAAPAHPRALICSILKGHQSTSSNNEGGSKSVRFSPLLTYRQLFPMELEKQPDQPQVDVQAEPMDDDCYKEAVRRGAGNGVRLEHYRDFQVLNSSLKYMKIIPSNWGYTLLKGCRHSIPNCRQVIIPKSLCSQVVSMFERSKKMLPGPGKENICQNNKNHHNNNHHINNNHINDNHNNLVGNNISRQEARKHRQDLFVAISARLEFVPLPSPLWYACIVLKQQRQRCSSRARRRRGQLIASFSRIGRNSTVATFDRIVRLNSRLRYTVFINERCVRLLAAPQTVRSLQDVVILLKIVDEVKENDAACVAFVDAN